MKKNRPNALTFIPLLLWFFVSQTLVGQHSFYSIQLGDYKVTALSDGSVDIDVDELFDAQEELKASDLTTKAFLQNPVEVSINSYLIQSPTQTILVDVGAGELFGASAGKLVQSLHAYGLQPEDITDILITHIHVDHAGGLTLDNKRVYPNATIHINEIEFTYWLTTMNSDEARNTLSAEQKKIVIGVQNAVSLYRDSNQIATFKNQVGPLFPHIEVLPTVGHTPGHTVYVLHSQDEQIYFWGDLVHVVSVQFEAPFLTNHFDEDQNLAKSVRNSFYQHMAQKQSLIAGAHQSFPGFGRIRQMDNHYEWIAVPYSVTGRTK